MFVLGILVLVVVAVLVLADIFVPYSEMMGAFKNSKRYYATIVFLLLVAGYFFGAYFYAQSQENWRESPVIQLQTEDGVKLYTGEKNKAAIFYDGSPTINEPYQTNLMLWHPYNKIKLHLFPKGKKNEGYSKSLAPNKQNKRYHTPTTLKFNKKGLWKIKIYGDGQLIKDIVIRVKPIH